MVKKLLKADFVGWVTEGDRKSLRVKVGANEHLLPLEGDIINEETYKHLMQNLIKTNVDEELKPQEDEKN